MHGAVHGSLYRYPELRLILQFPSKLPSHQRHLLLRLLVCVKDTLLHQFIGSRTSLELLLESIGPHLLVKGFLISHNAGCSVRVREDVA